MQREFSGQLMATHSGRAGGHTEGREIRTVNKHTHNTQERETHTHTKSENTDERETHTHTQSENTDRERETDRLLPRSQ